MAIVTKKGTEIVRVNKNFYKILRKIRNSTKKILAWIFQVTKSAVHLVFYQKTEPTDKIARETLNKHRGNTYNNLPNDQLSRFIR